MPMCVDFLFGVCCRRTCKHFHSFKLCTHNCGRNNCKFFHISGNDLWDLITQARPFNKVLQLEVERVAYTYTANDTTGKYCAAILSGGKCGSEYCRRCAPQPNHPFCRRCKAIVFRGNAYILWCGHLICNKCINFLPTKVEAIMLYECPACGDFGVPLQLFG